MQKKVVVRISITYFFIQLVIYSTVVVVSFLRYTHFAEWQWLLVAVVYLAIVGGIYSISFDCKSIATIKVIIFFSIGIMAMWAVRACYLPIQQLFIRFDTEHYYRMLLLLNGALVTCYQIFVIFLFALVTKLYRGRKFRRSEKLDYLFWFVLIIAVYFTAFYSYPLNFQRIFTGHYDELMQRYEVHYDYSNANFNITLATISSLPGLLVLVFIILSRLEQITPKNLSVNMNAISRWIKIKEIWKPMHPGYIGDSISAVVVSMFASFLIFVIGIWVSVHRGGYLIFITLLPLTIVFFYVTKRIYRKRKMEQNKLAFKKKK